MHDPNVREEYKKWLKEDVAWIITDEEMADFVNLSTDQQRDQFVVAFWERRNPNPGAKENEFKEEHYRRIAFANQHFGSGKIPGWKTDRGRIYIQLGPPDSVDQFPAYMPALEIWHYALAYTDLTGTGERNAVLRFVDECICGEYRMSLPERSNEAFAWEAPPAIFDPLDPYRFP